jgi:hypothetical protein
VKKQRQRLWRGLHWLSQIKKPREPEARLQALSAIGWSTLNLIISGSA